MAQQQNNQQGSKNDRDGNTKQDNKMHAGRQGNPDQQRDSQGQFTEGRGKSDDSNRNNR